MKPRVVKRETATQLELTLKLFVDTVQLRLDKVLCLKCDICARVCPRDAVIIIPGDEGLDISIDPRLCLMCEICAHFCPVAAVTLSYNGQVKTIMADHQGLAPFLPKIDMDKSRCLLPCPAQPDGEEHWCRQQIKLVPNDLTECPKQCHKCLAACPRQAIVLDEAAGQTSACARPVSEVHPVPDGVRVRGHCASTPNSAGRLVIDDHKCPPDCVKCIELCPVKAIIREGDRVWFRVENCAYCGVCVNICDDAAITLVREEVVAEAGEFSNAWATAVGKLVNK